MIPPRLCTMNTIGSYIYIELLCLLNKLKGSLYTLLSISLSSLTAKSRPCCDTLFLLFAWKSCPMTSALYPYVHIRACGRSGVRYSSGQKISDEAVEVLVCLLSSVFSLFFFSPKKVLMLLCLSARVLSSRSILDVSRGCDHVSRGRPRRPWTKMTLLAVRARCS
jgi:hypothetical protein